MVRLQLPIHATTGHKEEPFSHHIGFAHPPQSSAGHSDKTNFLHLASTGDDHEKKALELLEKAVNPVERRYRHAILPLPGRTTTVVTKTKLGLGSLSFSPVEVVGVGLDAQSIAAAESLGFKAQSNEPATPGGTSIVRFLVPPTADAIRGQHLLSKQFPGHRFELNKIYRIYRAATRDDSGSYKQGEQAPAACTPDRCFSRNIIQWQDQFAACARGLRVGIIDTGVDVSHPAFKGQHIHRVNFAPETRPAAPDWHGTGVLGVLAGNPESGTPGLVPGAEFYAANIFFAEENDGMATDTISLMKALDWMRANDVKVINMSFSGPEDDLVRETIEKLSSNGVVLVAAVGNEGPTADPAYPAAYPQVIAVTAVTKELRNYRYANRGNHIDVSAPGVDIWTAVPGGLQGYHSGTSFAAPHVTAILALMPREDFAKNKNDILDGLPVVDLGSPGRDPIYGRGLLVAPPSCSPPSESMASADR